MRPHALRTIVVLAALAALMALPVSAQQGVEVSQESVQGRPVFDAGAGPAYYVWSDGEGFHVHWGGRGGTWSFRGEVTTDGTITSLKREDWELDDLIRRTNNAISWEAQTSGATDGFAFTTSQSADWVQFTLYVDGRLIPPAQIFIGTRGMRPAGNPFVLRVRGGFSRDRWPAVYRGQPRTPPTFNAAYFVWVDDDVWRVRWASRGARELSGLVSTDGRFSGFRKVELEGEDAVARAERLIGWETRTRGGMDGIDFRTSGERLNFTLLIDGVAASPSQIYLGASGAHPPRNPWRVTR
ncbi:MAG: hypothetical protein QN178_03330 [Armatimonadota bacterium]|nr:hypothetical protein [Armatimonadota bacterium]